MKENGNFERLGLSADFEICDDTQRTRIVKEIAAKLKLKKNETDDFDRAISVFKMGGGILKTGSDISGIKKPQDKKVIKFLYFITFLVDLNKKTLLH